MRTRREYEPEDISPGDDLHSIIAIAIAIATIEGDLAAKKRPADANFIMGKVVSTFLNMIEAADYEIVRAGVPDEIRNAFQ